jgi:predicted MFS family arabinose efflux permease
VARRWINARPATDAEPTAELPTTGLPATGARPTAELPATDAEPTAELPMAELPTTGVRPTTAVLPTSELTTTGLPTNAGPRAAGGLVRRAGMVLLAMTVGLVLADSAIVTLALPEILRRLGGTVGQVAWVLIAFNLVLAAVVVPAAWACTRWDPAPLCAGGIAILAVASVVCAVAGSMPVLIAARCGQAFGGAFALVGCLELLVTATDERRGVTRWIAAGVIGTAVGPVVGGLLTEAISWQAIFIVQVPVAVLAAPAAFTASSRVVRRAQVHRPAIGPNVALVLLSAALTAALFLLVLLLVEGWRRSPAVAALTVSVVPVAAFIATPLARLARAGPRAETAAGCLLIAGGLAALALPPSAELAWTIAPQALIGLGLGLTVDRLTVAALRGRLPRAMHGGWTISARHIGVVLGLAILTPVFSAELHDAQVPAQRAITALVLDAPLPTPDKIAVARALSDRLSTQGGRVPDLHPVFAQLRLAPAERPAAAQLERNLNGQLERAATRAFRDSFLIAAGLALLALIPLIPVPPIPRRGVSS